MSGFENVPAALAAAAALQARLAERDELDARQRALVDRIRDRVAATVPDVEVVGDPVARLPHLVTFSCLYVDGEAVVTSWTGVASRSPRAPPAPRRRWPPRTCSRRWACSPTGTCGSP